VYHWPKWSSASKKLPPPRGCGRREGQSVGAACGLNGTEVHATLHTSHITRHTSQITHHTSHIRLHTSHVTHHTSHITHHASHVTVVPTFLRSRHLKSSVVCSCCTVLFQCSTAVEGGGGGLWLRCLLEEEKEEEGEQEGGEGCSVL
jgi:hypothetical protein